MAGNTHLSTTLHYLPTKTTTCHIMGKVCYTSQYRRCEMWVDLQFPPHLLTIPPDINEYETIAYFIPMVMNIINICCSHYHRQGLAMYILSKHPHSFTKRNFLLQNTVNIDDKINFISSVYVGWLVAVKQWNIHCLEDLENQTTKQMNFVAKKGMLSHFFNDIVCTFRENRQWVLFFFYDTTTFIITK